jgi:hypothetical protein
MAGAGSGAGQSSKRRRNSLGYMAPDLGLDDGDGDGDEILAKTTGGGGSRQDRPHVVLEATDDDTW